MKLYSSRVVLAFVLGALALPLSAQGRKPTANEATAISDGMTAAMQLCLSNPCPLVWRGLREADMAPKEVDPKLPRDVQARTDADNQASNGDHVWTEQPNNVIRINARRFNGSAWRMGMSTAALNNLVGAGLLFAEAGHQDLSSRTDSNGDFKADPPGTPNPKTAEENKAAWKKSEVEVADRFIWYLDWLLACANGATPAIELTQKDRDAIDALKKGAQAQKEANK
jgi:hypothetical protein